MRSWRHPQRSLEDQHLRAYFFWSGTEGYPEDKKRAIELLEYCCLFGYGPSRNKLANILKDGEDGVQKDVAKALALFEEGHEAGDAYSSYSLANMLLFSLDADPSNANRAVSLLEHAIEQGQEEASYTLAYVLCFETLGVPRNAERAQFLLNLGVDRNCTISMNALAILLLHGESGFEKDVLRCFDLLERSIILGDEEAVILLARIFEEGTPEIRKDLDKAMEIYVTSAMSGNRSAMTELVHFLQLNKGMVTKNPRAVMNFLELAVENRNFTAANKVTVLMLGIFEDGFEHSSRHSAFRTNSVAAGVDVALIRLGDKIENSQNAAEKDVLLAMRLYIAAIYCSDSVAAMLRLAKLFIMGGQEDSTNIPQAVALLERAIECGDLKAMVMLAELIVEGRVPQNPLRARNLYEQAAAGGDVDAMLGLALLLRNGSHGVRKDPIRAKKLFERASMLEH